MAIKTFSDKGNAVPDATRRSTVNIGVRLENGYIYVRPRLRADEGIGGPSVSVTNTAYAKYRNQRTASIGANAAGQQKRWS